MHRLLALVVLHSGREEEPILLRAQSSYRLCNYQDGTCCGAELPQTLVFLSTARPLGRTTFCHCDLPRTKMAFSPQGLTQTIIESGLWKHLFVDWMSFAFLALRAVSFRVSRSSFTTSPLCAKRSRGASLSMCMISVVAAGCALSSTREQAHFPASPCVCSVAGPALFTVWRRHPCVL